MAPRPSRKLNRFATGVIARTVKAAAHDPDPVSAARTIARGTTIAGSMLEDLSDQRHTPTKRFAGWLTWVGRIFWGLVELAAPRSLGELLFQYWIWLVYALAAGMILIGSVTGAGVVRAGITIAAFAVATHLAVGILRNWLHRRPWLFGGWVPPLVAGIAAIGFGYAAYQFEQVPLNRAIGPGWGQMSSPQAVANLLGQPNDSDPKTQANYSAAFRSLRFRWLALACFVIALGAAGVWLVDGAIRPHWPLGLVLLLTSATAIAAAIGNLRAWIALSGLNWSLPDTSVATVWLAGISLYVVFALRLFGRARRGRKAG